MPARLATPDDAWKHRYCADGLSMSDIARESGVAKNTVRDRLLAAGVTFDKSARLSRKSRGRPSPRKGVILSESTKVAIGKRSLGNKHCVGRVISEETRAKHREAQRLLNDSPERRARAALSAVTEHKRQKFKRALKSLLRSAKLRKHSKTSEMLGYSRDTLIAHIETQFQSGMAWADRTSFSIDHRIPVVEFIRRGITDPKIVSSLANLQPMVPKANREKSDSYSGDFEADLAAIIRFNAERA